MKAEIKVKIGRATHRLAMPIGALEDIAEVNPQIGVVMVGLENLTWTLPELRAVIEAGLKHGGAKITAEELIPAVGLKRAAEIARDAVRIAFADPEAKNADGPGGTGAETEATDAS